MTGPLTGVLDWGDFVIAKENQESVYFDDAIHDPDRYDGEYEVEPQGDWHEVAGGGCGFDASFETGRVCCAHGYWYDRDFWRESLT